MRKRISLSQKLTRIKNGQIIETERRLVLPGAGAERRGVSVNGYGVSFWVDEKVLELDRGGGCTTF